MTSPYPDLAHLLGAYFHQDFDMYGDEWGVVDAFIARNPARAERVPDQISQLLHDFASESDVEAFADAYGCAYLPEGRDDPYRNWLAAVASYVTRRLEDQPPPA